MDYEASVDYVQSALNDLPTIYPLTVSVVAPYESYVITFPVEMGDVPPLVIISSIFANARNATEIVAGVASGSKLAFQLDGAITKYLDFWNENITNEILQNTFREIFTIRCPPSLNNQQVTPSIVYVNDFETSNSYDETTPLVDSAFCGRNRATYSGSTLSLVTENNIAATYMCFAYKIPTGTTIIMNFYASGEEDLLPLSYIDINITYLLIIDGRWHYTCIEILPMFENYNSMYTSLEYIIIREAQLQTVLVGAMFDTVTLRTSEPIIYEGDYDISTIDQASANSCTFPFSYNGQSYNKCTLDENNVPICRSASGQKLDCQSSSIEGVQRLFPKYQLLNDQFNITHLNDNHTIDVSFRYTDCKSPTLIKSLPSSVSH